VAIPNREEHEIAVVAASSGFRGLPLCIAVLDIVTPF